MKLSIAIILLMLLVVLVAGCTTSVEPIEDELLEEKPPIAPSSPISVKLTMTAFTETLKLGSETDLIVTVSSLDGKFTYNNTIARIDLPEGISLVGGDIEQLVDLKPALQMKKILVKFCLLDLVPLVLPFLFLHPQDMLHLNRVHQ